MLIRSIALKNIRSYNDGGETEVDIPDGVVLFEGDVGSGKSTILYAIEFALFGTAEVSGAHLLSEGRDEGNVRMGFTVEGRNIEVHRGLRRRKAGIVQEDCYIVLDGEKTPLSSADLKERIISLLKFNEPSSPRAESLVYRFAVFTPQEQMKEIVQKSSEDRLQVLRRVLGIQDYKTAADNSEVVVQRIKRNVHGLKKASEDLEEKEAQSDQLSREFEGLNEQIPRLEEEELAASQEQEKLDAQWKRLLKDKEVVTSTTQKVPELEKNINTLEEIIEDELKKADRQEARLRDQYLPFIEAFQRKSPPSEKGSEALEDDIAEKRKTKEEKGGQLVILERQLRETSDLITSGLCPLCGQRIPEESFTGKLNHIEEELGKEKSVITGIETELSRLVGLHKKMLSYEEDRRAYERYVKERSNLEHDISEAHGRASKYREELVNLKDKLEKAKREESKLNELNLKIEKLERSLKEAQRKKEEAGKTLTKAVTQRDEKGKDLERRLLELKKKKDMRTEAQRLSNYQVWLTDFFRPTVEMIEKQMMVQMNARFNHHFQRLFSSLVDDPDLRVRVNEDFSPILERQGFEQEYGALSGGERTSVALAYRLALNAIVQEVAATGTGELVILDEPTDGFSKEQIYKMRDILAELNARQVILVSHEAELEAMAQHIFHVEKVNGTSRVRRATTG